MAEPLSLAASVAGIVQLAELVTHGLYRFAKQQQNFRQEITDLLLAVSSLSGVLTTLKILTQQHQEWSSTDFVYTQGVASCSSNLEKLRRILEAFTKAEDSNNHGTVQHNSVGNPQDSPLKNLGHRIAQRAQWPFKGSEVQDIMRKLEHDKSTFTLALTVDSLPSLLKILGPQEEERFDRMKDADQKVLHTFNHVDPARRRRQLTRQRQVGTGLWLLEREYYQDFVKEENAKLWIYGIPGAGKSTLATTIIDDFEMRRSGDVAVAYFFCDYSNSSSQVLSNILSSVASQLARQRDDALAYLLKYYRDHESSLEIAPQFSELQLLELVKELSNFFGRTFVVIDGLDECADDRQRLFSTLASLGDDSGHDFNTLYLSRQDIDIKGCLKDFSAICIMAESDDIRLFVLSELDSRFSGNGVTIRSPALKEEIMTHLTKGAAGMFQWVRCQLDYLSALSSDRERREALKNLPPTLPKTYERILNRIIDRTQGAPLTRQDIQKALKWVALSPQNLKLSTILTAIAISNSASSSLDEGMELDLDDFIPDSRVILRNCSGLFLESPDGTLELSHFSVREYLEGISRDASLPLADFGLHSEDHSEIAATCLRINLRQTLKDPEQLDEGLLNYAADYWDFHWSHCPTPRHPTLLKLASQLFDPSKTDEFSTWAKRRLMRNQEFRELTEERLRDTTTLHMACLCNVPELVSLLLDRDLDPNKISLIGTPIHCAVFSDTPLRTPTSDVTESLLAAGVTPTRNTEDLVLETIRRKRPNCAKALIQARFAVTKSAMRALKVEARDLRISGESRIARKDWVDAYELALRMEIRDGEFMETEHLDYLNPDAESLLEDLKSPTQWPLAAFSKTALKSAKDGSLETVKRILAHLSEETIKAEFLLERCLRGASKYGHLDVVQYLLSIKANPTHKNKSGATSMHIACRSGRLEIFKQLYTSCQKNKCEMPGEDGNGLTLLHQACWASQLAIVEHLFKDPNFDYASELSKTTDAGETALHLAIRPVQEVYMTGIGKGANHLVPGSDLVSFLLSNGASTTAVDNSGKRPIISCFSNCYIADGCDNCREEFLRKCYFLLDAETSLVSELDSTPIVHFIFQYPLDLATAIWKSISENERLRNGKHAAMKHRCSDGLTPLHRWCFPELSLATLRHVEFLSLDPTFDLSIRNALGNTVLMSICTLRPVDGQTWQPIEGQRHFLLEAIRLLINTDSGNRSLNLQDNTGFTVLHHVLSVLCNQTAYNLELFKLLLKAGAKLNLADYSGSTPLMSMFCNYPDSATRGTPPMNTALWLLENEKSLSLDLLARDRFGKTLFHKVCQCSFGYESLRNKRSFTAIFLKLLPDIINCNVHDKSGYLPIHYAVALIGDPEIARVFVVTAAERLRLKTFDGKDCWSLACANGKAEVVQAMVDAGQDVQATINSLYSSIWTTPLLQAADSANIPVVLLLLSLGADSSRTNLEGLSLLHFMCWRRALAQEPEIRRQCLSLDHSGATASFTYNDTTSVLKKERPIHMLSINGNIEALKWILEICKPHQEQLQQIIKYPFDIDAQTEDGYGALHFAAMCDQRDICEVLIRAGANPNIQTDQGLTPLQVAIQHNKPAICEILTNAGGNIAGHSEAITMAQESGGDITQHNVSPDFMQISEPTSKREMLLQAIRDDDLELCVSLSKDLDYDGNPWFSELGHPQGSERTPSCCSCSPLLLASIYDCEEMATALLETSGGLESSTCSQCGLKVKAGVKPIHLAVFKRQMRLLKALIASGADLDATQKCHHGTALHLAVSNDDVDIVRLLCTSEANLDIPDIDGDTPLLLVSGSHSSPQILELLIHYGANLSASDISGDTAAHNLASNAQLLDLLIRSGGPIDQLNHFGTPPVVFYIPSKDAEAQGPGD
ncbi:ankyrin [Rhizodiscina lignyota]|uniref:Ankyrin n=1 Tax=Rhizodiscina lignyota TaxID=1504668 RepID=A0A9P4ILH1_9PEZI|nr:ankyrin [Rhizodiscina lignyota]